MICHIKNIFKGDLIMKKILCVLLSLIMSVSLIAIPLSAQAETKYWADMNFAKNNIEGLKNYIKNYGTVDDDGDKYISYYIDKYDFLYLIIYEYKTGMLDFLADFGNNIGYIDMYYSYPYSNPEASIVHGSSEAKASVSVDVTEYNGQELSWNISQRVGDATDAELQNFGNLQFKAAIEGWNNCLIQNTSYTLASIGFNSLCNHNLTRSYYAATLSTDGTIEDYCYKCGYHEDTDIPCVSQVKLSKKSFTYNGKVQKPSVTVIDSKGNIVSADNYSVSYSNSGSKKVGSYGIYISFIGSKYSGSISYVYKIIPKSSAISSLKGAKKKITVKYKKQTSQTSGYQIQVATDKAFKKNKKTVTVKKNKTTSANVSSLKAKKKYFVRVRTYKTVNGKKIYSSWSKVKTIKTK